MVPATAGLVEDCHPEAVVALVAEATAKPGAQLITGDEVWPPGGQEAASVAFHQYLHTKARLPLAGLHQHDVPRGVKE